MTHSTFKIIPLILPIMVSMACGTGRSADVKQSTIEQSYAVTYNEGTAQLRATAAFHYENTLGTSLKLTGNSSISFADLPMQASSILSTTSYVIEKQQLLPPTGAQSFRYVNNDGEVFITPARVPALTQIKMPREGDVLSSATELPVLMQGETLAAGEALTLCLTLEAATAEANLQECLRSSGRLNLVFSREQLARFPLGRELKLEIKRESEPLQDNPRLHLTQTFLSKPLHVTLQ